MSDKVRDDLDSDDELIEILEDLLPADFELHPWQIRVLRNVLHGAWRRGYEASSNDHERHTPPESLSPYVGYR